MVKKTLGLLGGASALAIIGASAAAEARALEPAQSYAELLNPIADATEVLKADNERATEERPIQLAQYYHHHHHHYHHHHYHHHHYHHHHHHHHHYMGFYIPVPQ